MHKKSATKNENRESPTPRESTGGEAFSSGQPKYSLRKKRPPNWSVTCQIANKSAGRNSDSELRGAKINNCINWFASGYKNVTQMLDITNDLRPVHQILHCC